MLVVDSQLAFSEFLVLADPASYEIALDEYCPTPDTATQN